MVAKVNLGRPGEAGLILTGMVCCQPVYTCCSGLSVHSLWKDMPIPHDFCSLSVEDSLMAASASIRKGCA